MEEMTYEKAMERLKEITKLLEDENTELTKSLELYEEGTRLAAFCNDFLDNAEQKITKLS